MNMIKIGDTVVSNRTKHNIEKGKKYKVLNITPCESSGIGECIECPGFITLSGLEENCCYGYESGYLFKKYNTTWKGRLL